MKISLLIQGPIYSKGVSYNGIISNYNSYNNIVLLVRSFKVYSDRMILVTYKEELSVKQKKILLLMGLEIIELDNINLDYESVDLERGLLKGLFSSQTIKNTSKFYQYRSTIAGLKSIIKTDKESITIKVRTDINFSVDKLLLKIFNNDFHLRRVILQYLVFKRILWLRFLVPVIPDQIIVGRANELYKLYSMANSSNFSSNVHYDLCISLINVFGTKQKPILGLENRLKKSRGMLFVVYHLLFILFRFLLSIKFKKVMSKISRLDEAFSESIEWRGKLPSKGYYKFKSKEIEFSE